MQMLELSDYINEAAMKFAADKDEYRMVTKKITKKLAKKTLKNKRVK